MYSDTHYEIIEFEVEGFLISEKLKIFQGRRLCFGQKNVDLLDISSPS